MPLCLGIREEIDDPPIDDDEEKRERHPNFLIDGSASSSSPLSDVIALYSYRLSLVTLFVFIFYTLKSK